MEITIAEVLDSLPAQSLDTPLKESFLLGFDTETTGTRAGKDAIVSASLVLRNPALGFNGDSTQDWIINPGIPMNPRASQVNGFTDDYLREHGANQADSIALIASSIIKAQIRNIPLLAYNAPFDITMLNGDLQKLGQETLSGQLLVAAQTGNDSSGGSKSDSESNSNSEDEQEKNKKRELLIVDPLVIDRALSHRSGKRTLTDTTYYYGVQPHGSFHDATADTIAAVDLIAPISEAYPQAGDLPVGQLMDWQRRAHQAWKKQFNDYLLSRGRKPVTDSWFPR